MREVLVTDLSFNAEESPLARRSTTRFAADQGPDATT